MEPTLHPKNLWYVYETAHHLRPLLGTAEYGPTLDEMKKRLGPNLESKLAEVVNDFVVLLTREINSENYARAFKRFLDHYENMEGKEFQAHAEYLMSSFNIQIRKPSATVKEHKTPPDIRKLLEHHKV